MDQSRRRILCVDATPKVRADIDASLSDLFDIQYSTDRENALARAHEGTTDIIVVDATHPKLFSADLITKLRKSSGRISLIVVSPAGQVGIAVQAMKCGATEVLEGPISPTAFLEVVTTLSGDGQLAVEANGRPTRRQVKYLQGDCGPMAGRSTLMKDLFTKIDQIGRRETTVLVTGESGTGKELIAREIHNRSPRCNKPFIAINCAAIPETLIESELFGHEKGAFTHAVERRLGQCELADGGTLFLDEIGELSLAVQVKLLRFLQEQEFFRVGRSKPITVDVRVITATNRNLEEQVRLQQFRQDLLYRINVINLHVPPLRDRHGDLPILIEHCVRKLGPLYGGRQMQFSAEAMDMLNSYRWPGNVRELENVVESLLALSPKDEVGIDELPCKIREFCHSGEARVMGSVNASGLAFDQAERIFETDMIVKALKKANFVQTRAADLLGISRRILKYKMDKLNINDRGEVVAPDSDNRQ